eukprot:m.1637758 g.1637758  ORF g.1637758 m.1637758 type:complete len:373 (+) comp26183_c0_seq1:147-1265(+)
MASGLATALAVRQVGRILRSLGGREAARDAPRQMEKKTKDGNRSSVALVPAAIAAIGGFDVGEAKPTSIAGDCEDACRHNGDIRRRRQRVPISCDAVPLDGIKILVANNVPVPAARLIEDLPWTTLLNCPTAVLGSLHLERVQAERSRLEKLKRFNINLDPKNAEEIYNRFIAWMNLMDLSKALECLPRQEDIDESVEVHMKEYCDDMSNASETRSRVDVLLQRGLFEEARRLAEYALNKLNRLSQLISLLRQRLEERSDEALGRMLRYLKMTGGFAVIATVSSYVGCCADVPDVPQHLLQSAADFSTLAAIVCVRTTMCEWLLSNECEEYLCRVRSLQYDRQQAVKSLEATLEDILFRDAEKKIQSKNITT